MSNEGVPRGETVITEAIGMLKDARDQIGTVQSTEIGEGFAEYLEREYDLDSDTYEGTSLVRIGDNLRPAQPVSGLFYGSSIDEIFELTDALDQMEEEYGIESVAEVASFEDYRSVESYLEGD